MKIFKKYMTVTNINIINPKLYDAIHGVNMKIDKRTPIGKALNKFSQYCKSFIKL